MTKLASALLLAFAANSALAQVVGTSNGIWVDPIPANATFSGVKTSTFLWGKIFSGKLDNTLAFTGFGSPESFNGKIGTPFKVGSLIYHNGTTETTGLADRVSLQLELNFTVPGFGKIVGTYPFELESTPNTSWDPNKNADYVRLPSTATVKQFEVDGLKYELSLSKFGNVQDDGFLTSTGSQFHVREQKSASADLFATVTFLGGGPPPIPEPATYGMMLAGLGALGLMVARRRRYF